MKKMILILAAALFVSSIWAKANGGAMNLSERKQSIVACAALAAKGA